MLSSLLRKVSLMAGLLFTHLFLLAQDRVFTGKVTETKDGSPVSGASVLVKGSRTGTSTDADGNFRLSVANNASVLVVSSVGYDNIEVDIAGKSTVTAS